MSKQNIGVIGLAVMGKNLALNIAEHGFGVSVYNRSPQKTKELLEESEYENLTGTYTLEEFTQSLKIPRKIILMVKAGTAVDETIKQLLPLLEKGDVIVDGGNSFYKDTIRRCGELNKTGIHFVGMGVSGGEEGARKGPAIMPGGNPEVYEELKPILHAISAKVEEEPCCTYIGEDGAGHFVKMVHNGIEYADMQLICEAYSILKNLLKLKPDELHEIFKEWNEGELNSFLIEITSEIFTKKDTESEDFLVDRILDVAGQKGTGKWTSQVSLDIGTAIPTITEAVFERYISTKKDEREEAFSLLQYENEVEIENPKEFIEAIRRALYCSKICCYAQGFALMEEASKQYNWNLELGNISKIFRGGCIIRAQFLNKIKEAYDHNPELPNLLTDEYFSDSIAQYHKDWRKVTAVAIQAGIAVPAFSSAISYFDSYRSKNLPLNLLQAQRDYFGAHTYQRTDKEGIFHTQW